ncbi:hypothetical protein ACLMJK_008690 [Lecanora helva]
MATDKELYVGLAVGRGTGPELADIFTDVLSYLAGLFDISVNVSRSPRIYHTYHSLMGPGYDFQRIHDETMQDAAHYEEFCRQQAANGVRSIFRTAITAQSLYLVRQKLEAVKVGVFTSKSAEVILVRDEAQGFYSGSNEYTPDFGSVSRNSSFTYDVFDRLLSYAIKRAEERWGDDARIDAITLVYKCHLFEGIFDTWSQNLTRKYGLTRKYSLRIQFLQPDTMNRNILMNGFKSHELIIGGNEYADIMEGIFLDMFDRSTQECSYSKNIYLAQSMCNLVEYQTVHGSADDLTGQDLVNPSATMKAAANILEEHGRGQYSGLESSMDRAIRMLVKEKKCTKDAGGSLKTSDFIPMVLEKCIQMYQNGPPQHDSLLPSLPLGELQPIAPSLSTLGIKSALVIIDFQKDFAARVNASSPSIGTLTSNISRLLSYVRKGQSRSPSSPSPSSRNDIDIIHVKFQGGSPEYEQRRQMRIQNNPSKSYPKVGIPGTPGADFIIPPPNNERIFTKSVYDPFLDSEFAAHIQDNGIKHLILAGLHGDVCVDTTARSGFQRDLWISIVEGCVGNLHLNIKDWMSFARDIYGARMVNVDDFKGDVKEQGVAVAPVGREVRALSKL